MTTPTAPAWTRSAQRLDRPDLDVWWKPEQHGPLDGFLVWQGDLPDRRTGEPNRVFAIRDAAAGAVVYAVTERAALRSLRHPTAAPASTSPPAARDNCPTARG